MAVTTFTKVNLTQLRAQIDAELAAMSERLGVKLTLGSGSFTATNCTFKLVMSVIGENGEAVAKEAETYKQLAKLYGLKPEWLGQTFTLNGKQFTVYGLDTKKRKFPVLAKSSDGKCYKMPVETVVARMAAVA